MVENLEFERIVSGVVVAAGILAITHREVTRDLFAMLIGLVW